MIDRTTENIKLAINGNKVAFELLVSQFYQEIARFIAGYQLGSLEIDDIVQESFITAYKNIHTLQPPYNFRAWLYKIADNLAKDNWRKKKSIVSIGCFDLPLEIEPEDANSDRLFLIINIIEQMSPLLKDTAKLFFLYGLSINNITRKLDIPAGTVKRRLFDAREFIRKEFLNMQNTEKNSNMAPLIEVSELKEDNLTIKHDHLSMFFGNFGQEPQIESVVAAKTYEYPGGLLDFVEVVVLKRKVKILNTDLCELIATKKKNNQPFDEPITTYLEQTTQGYEVAFCAYLKEDKSIGIDSFHSGIQAGVLTAPFSSSEQVTDVVILNIDNGFKGKCLRSVKFMDPQTAIESYWSIDGKAVLIRFYHLAENNTDKELYLINNHSRLLNGKEYRLRYDIVHDMI